MSHLDKKDFEVRDVDIGLAKAFIKQFHYSGGCSNTRVYTHGLFVSGTDTLMGVAWWLPPTRVAAESVNKEHWTKVLSLSRLAIHPDVPTNGASFLLGRSIRLVRADKRFVSLVTYADDFMGHSGAIYLATNWRFDGVSKPYPRWENAAGQQVAKKATRSRTNAEMEALNLRCVGSFRKRKFVLHLDGRSAPFDPLS